MLKSVGYAYATSSHAKQFGRYKTGCYTVTTHKTVEDPGKASGPFDSREEAFAYADTLDGDWWPFSMPREVPA